MFPSGDGGEYERQAQSQWWTFLPQLVSTIWTASHFAGALCLLRGEKALYIICICPIGWFKSDHNVYIYLETTTTEDKLAVAVCRTPAALWFYQPTSLDPNRKQQAWRLISAVTWDFNVKPNINWNWYSFLWKADHQTVSDSSQNMRWTDHHPAP